jgi:hypothetical protein
MEYFLLIHCGQFNNGRVTEQEKAAILQSNLLALFCKLAPGKFIVISN